MLVETGRQMGLLRLVQPSTTTEAFVAHEMVNPGRLVRTVRVRIRGRGSNHRAVGRSPKVDDDGETVYDAEGRPAYSSTDEEWLVTMFGEKPGKAKFQRYIDPTSGKTKPYPSYNGTSITFEFPVRSKEDGVRLREELYFKSILN